MPLEDLAKLLVPTIENLNLMIYLCMFVKDWRFSKRMVIFSCCAVLILLAPFTLWFSLKYGTSQEVLYMFSPVCHIAEFACILFLGKKEHGRLIFSLSVSYMLVYLCSALYQPLAVGSYYYQAFVRLFAFAAFAYVNFRYHRKILFEAMEWIERGWYILSMIPISLLPFLMYRYHLGNPSMEYYAICVEAGLIYFVLLRLLVSLKKQHQAEEESTLLQTHVSAIRQYCEQLEGLNQNARIIRHDLRHYCQLMENAIRKDNREEAIEILQNLRNKITALQISSASSPQNASTSSNSSVVNSLLSYYESQAQKNHISIKISVILPEHPSFDTMEFCVLMSNGLENAIRACSKIPDIQQRKLVVSGAQRQNQFFFEIKNTYQEPVVIQDSLPVTNELGHGYGIRSIRSFAAKYHAIYDFEMDAQWFRFRILI